MNFSSIDFGVVYVATGSKYIDEALCNARFSRLYGQNLVFSIITSNVHHPGLGSVFDHILQHPCPEFSYRDKIVPLLNLPYEHTLFLDTDAKLIHDISSLLPLLTSFDLCASCAPVRIPPGWIDPLVPLSFPEINTGVLLLNRSSITHNLITSWLALYDNVYCIYDQLWDQASFRSVLWDFISTQSLSFYSLPPEFNLRTTKPWIVGRGSPAYILHGRYSLLEHNTFIEYLNTDIDKFRTYHLWLESYPHSSIRPRFDRTFD